MLVLLLDEDLGLVRLAVSPGGIDGLLLCVLSILLYIHCNK